MDTLNFSNTIFYSKIFYITKEDLFILLNDEINTDIFHLDSIILNDIGNGYFNFFFTYFLEGVEYKYLFPTVEKKFIDNWNELRINNKIETNLFYNNKYNFLDVLFKESKFIENIIYNQKAIF